MADSREERARIPFDPARMRAARRVKNQAPLSVSEITRHLRAALERQFPDVWVVGEVSNLGTPQSGHIYFTLKDESAQIAAVLWRSDAARHREKIADGLRVIVRGAIAVYEKRGVYQIAVRHVEPAGAGALEQALKRLVARLEKEGLFAPEHKKPIPRFPARIAVVTSPCGAAVRDILRTIDTRFPHLHVVVFPVKVQGEGAAEEIAQAIALANRLGDFDVMILGRGGGSLEDLWAFNEEVVARAIFASEVPVITGVGHEIDVTVSDLVADERAATPTGAAQRVVPDEHDVAQHLSRLARRLGDGLANRLSGAESEIAGLRRALSPNVVRNVIREREMRLDDATATARRGAEMLLRLSAARLLALHGRLAALDPQAVLSRGYSITRRADDGKLLRRAGEVAPGQDIVTILAHGRITSKVEDIAEPERSKGRGEKEL